MPRLPRCGLPGGGTRPGWSSIDGGSGQLPEFRKVARSSLAGRSSSSPTRPASSAFCATSIAMSWPCSAISPSRAASRGLAVTADHHPGAPSVIKVTRWASHRKSPPAAPPRSALMHRQLPFSRAPRPRCGPPSPGKEKSPAGQPPLPRHACHDQQMIGRMHHVVLDCPDPAALAAFYSALFGLPVTYRDDDWVVVAVNDTSSGLAFQRAPGNQPPTWPHPGVPQQVHLDIMVEDAAAAGPRVLALGAVKLDGENVYADPAGHPFCLIRRPRWAPPIPDDV